MRCAEAECLAVFPAEDFPAGDFPVPVLGREATAVAAESPAAPAEPMLSAASAVVAVSDWLLFVGLLCCTPASKGLWTSRPCPR